MRVSASLVFAFFLSAQIATASVVPWPHEGSDLAPDPGIAFGRLENDFRFAVFPNSNSKGRISLRLLVAAGSLNENENERGLAHFIEHMAFNGTTNFPSGKLVEFLQRHGMGFGADVNAFTSYSSTIYKLELSDNSPESLHEALQVFRDYADGILFEPAAVERERGVILAEARVRDTASARGEIDQTKALYSNTLLPQRFPIGLPEIVQHATPDALKDFYHTWYRPSRMTLVVCGDFAASEVQREIQRSFSDLKSSAPVRPDFTLPPMEPDEIFSVQFHRDPGELGVRLALANIQNVDVHLSTKKDIDDRLALEVAYSILRERTQRLVSRKDSPEGGFGVATETVQRIYRQSLFVCGTNAGQWKAALRDLTIELLRARTQGFTAEEIARQRLGFENYLREAVASKNSRTSTILADQLTDSIASNLVALSPESQLALASASLANLTAETCQKALNEAWAGGRKTILVSANDSFAATPAEIAEVHEQGLRFSLGGPTDRQTAPFGYTDFGPAGEVAAKTLLPASDSWEVTFRNGVRLHFKQTGFEPNSVQIAIRFGSGRLVEPADKPGLGTLVIGALMGGLGKHSLDELSQILAGKHADTNFTVNCGGFLYSAQTTPDNALIFTQLMTACIVDPAFREESRGQTDAQIASYYQQNWDGPQGVISERIFPQLAGGDSRIGMPRRTTLATYSFSTFKDWFLPQSKFAPMDVIVVGDLSFDAAVQIVAKTTGALAPLLPGPNLEKYRKMPFPKAPFDFTWTVEGTKSQSGFVEFYWPLAKHVSGAEQLRLGLMMDILSDRLRVSIRQSMGKTYSPSTGTQTLRDFHDYGWLSCQIEASPADILRVQKAGLAQVAKLVKGGISADELQRARQVQLANLERMRQTNSYWLTLLGEAASYPESAEIRDHASEFIGGTTTDEIERLAREYLRADQISIFRIVPKENKK